MKKVFTILAVAAVMVSCGNKKKGDKPADGKDTAATTTTNNGGETTPITATAGFADAEVQKYVDDYTAFVNSYLDAVKGKDMTKITDLSMKAADWANRSMDVSKKLAANPEETKKFADVMTKLSNDWAEAAKALVPNMK